MLQEIGRANTYPGADQALDGMVLTAEAVLWY